MRIGLVSTSSVAEPALASSASARSKNRFR